MRMKLDTFLNGDLSLGSTRVDAVFSISPTGLEPAAAAPAAPALPRVLGLLADRSASMAGAKIEATRHALAAAIEGLDETSEFFIVSFSDDAKLDMPLARATERNKRAAIRHIARINPQGGTAMSRALAQARTVFASRPDAIRQAILLTDGENDQLDRLRLETELELCTGLFQAHCRGVGTDWSPAQLRRIADNLLGSVQMIADPAGLLRDFQETLALALSKSVAELRLRLWMPRNARLREFRQGYPTEVDLSDRLRIVGPQTIEVALGAWGDGTQDYTATFEVTACAPGQRMLVCRPCLVHAEAAGEAEATVPGAPVTVAWATDADTGRTNEQVAHYAAQAEKARAIQEGLAAIASKDDEAATRRLGRALQLAHSSGDLETTRRLRAVVDVVDEAAGTVRVRRDAARTAVMDLDVASTRTVRAKRT